MPAIPPVSKIADRPDPRHIWAPKWEVILARTLSLFALSACSSTPDSVETDEAGPESPFFQPSTTSAGTSEGFGMDQGIHFELLDPHDSNITTRHIRGVAINDFDRDGDQDIFLATYATRWIRREPDSHARPDGLYRNEGDLVFTPMAEQAFGSAIRTTAQAAAWGDLDGDGLDDLYVTTAVDRPNLLYRNRGDGTFEEIGRQVDVASTKFGRGIALADVNRDGYLDMYVSNFVANLTAFETNGKTEKPRRHPPLLGVRGCANHMFIHDSSGRYVDMAGAMGVEGLSDGEGWGAAFCDLNDDGYSDLFVTNDGRPDNFYVYRDGVFHDRSGQVLEKMIRRSRRTGAMGVALGDYDNDRDIDLYATNYYSDFLMENVNGVVLRRKSRESGIERFTNVIGMGVAFADFDNDGDLDLAVANGDVAGFDPVRNILMENVGGGCFVESTETAGPGFAALQRSQGLAIGDLDDDGRLDIVIGNDDGSFPSVLVNRTEGAGGWIRLRLVGNPPNTSAIGARVWLVAGDETQVRERRSGSSLYSCNENVIHFGLGEYTGLSLVKVRWPDGSFSEIEGVQARSTITVAQP